MAAATDGSTCRGTVAAALRLQTPNGGQPMSGTHQEQQQEDVSEDPGLIHESILLLLRLLYLHQVGWSSARSR